jgi:hypothetical protein
MRKGSRISWHFFGQDKLKMKKYYARVVDASITLQGVHLLVSGMATTYIRWVHHGEPLEDMVDDDANVQDNAILPDAERDVDNAARRDGGD